MIAGLPLRPRGTRRGRGDGGGRSWSGDRHWRRRAWVWRTRGPRDGSRGMSHPVQYRDFALARPSPEIRPCSTAASSPTTSTSSPPTAATAARRPTSARFADLDRLRRQLQADIDRLNQRGRPGEQVDRQGGRRRRARGQEGRGPPAPRGGRGARGPARPRSSAESDAILRAIPNLTHPAAPVGGEDAAVEIRRGSDAAADVRLQAARPRRPRRAS